MSNAPGDTSKTPKTVLVVDDDNTTRMLIVRALRDKYRVVEASDGMMALEILGRMAPPDLLICDVMMPRVDGFTLVGMIRSKEELRRMHVIFLTAKEGAGGVVHGLTLGARHYIAKPVRFAELVEKVDRILR